jgi:phosphatidylserine/phosphatidylglycerophosphate/cardiolipin synthase-like enzyme
MVRTLIAAIALLALSAGRAQAMEHLCDSSFENCRDQLLNLINNENVEIDVGLWFMEDGRYATALVNRYKAGVPVRILMDQRANNSDEFNSTFMKQLADGGIPMLTRTASGIEHWKVMVFAGQNTVYFGSANFSADAFVPVDPYKNYVDETIYFTDDPSVVNSFKTKFDDAWTDTSNYANYANAPSSVRVRHYPTYAIDPELNFPPGEDFANRSVKAYNGEKQKIDVMMYRITDRRHTDAIINAFSRGVPVRLIGAQEQYRDPTRYWDAWNIDRLYAAGVPIRMNAHQGVNHGKLVLLYGQNKTIFGSSNWTSASANSQHEENYFTTNTYIFNWFVNQFERKWNNTNPVGATETMPFTPLPPDKPQYHTPANGATGVSATGVQLQWWAGFWAHNYDIYFGTSATPPLYLAAQNLGPSTSNTDYKKLTLPDLNPGTTYYWKIVSKTMASLAAEGPVWSFTTAGTPPPPPPPPPGATTQVMWTANIPSSNIHGNWVRIADSSAAGGAALQNPNAGQAKISPALSSPANYFETTFQATANTAYHIWVRMRAQDNSFSNDSIHVQFSDSVDSLGSPMMRIGTTNSAEIVLEDGATQAQPHGWGWSENGWGSLGPHIYFANDGTHTIRIQQREDGAIVDQIVISPDTYLTSAPGGRTNDTTILTSTDGSTPPPPPGPSANTIVLWAAHVAPADVHGNWAALTDSTAADNVALQNPDAGAAKVAPALASPANYFETTFTAPAGTAYHLWVRMRAQGNSLSNDSVHVQFSDAVTSGGSATMRIGTTSSAEIVLQDGPGGAPDQGWGWSENGWGSLGPNIYFASSGTHTIRVQQREDGAIIDQIVLSPDSYLTSAPGPRQNDTTILPENDGSGSSVETLPSPWVDQDIGAVGVGGSAQYDSSTGTFTVRASGSDVWGTADAFHFVYEPLDGDGSVEARVASVGDVDKWSKAGVMIRDTLDPSSAHALMLVSAEKGVAFQYRAEAGGDSGNVTGSASAAPRWVRIERSGDQITGYESADGSTWTQVATQTIPMTGTVYVGLAVTSHNNSRLTTATFDNVNAS